MTRVKVGVIGAGYIAQSTHIPNYVSHPGAEIVGVADLDRKKLDEVRTKFGVRKVYLDYQELLKEKLDAVSICLPTKFHANVAIEAARKGINILCEKPIAASVSEADAMIKTCAENHVKLMMGFNLRFMRNHQLARNYVTSGKIGKPYMLVGQFTVEGPYADLKANKNSFYLNQASGGGVLFDTGPHLIDLMRWFNGEITSVKAEIGTHKEGISVDDHAALTFKFASGAIGLASMAWSDVGNWSSNNQEGFLKVFGTGGRVSSDYLGPNLKYYFDSSMICKHTGPVELSPKKFNSQIPFEVFQRSTYEEIDAFIRLVRGKSVNVATGEDGKRNLEIVLGAYESAGANRKSLLSGKERA